MDSSPLSSAFCVTDLDFSGFDTEGNAKSERQPTVPSGSAGSTYPASPTNNTGRADLSNLFRVGDICIDLMDGERGKGSFGIVYQGTNRKTGEQVAAKRLDVKKLDDIGEIMSEVEVLKRIPNHPNLVNMHDHTYRKPAFWIIMEYCDLGDLQKYFVEKNPNFHSKVDMMLQCACGLRHMHSEEVNIVHRDIKPANIMLKTGPKREVQVKLADFGLSKFVESDFGESDLMVTNAGTKGFMAPEFFAKVPYTKTVDVFALGLVFLAMLKFKNGELYLLPTIENVTELVAIGEVMHKADMCGDQQPTLVSDQHSDNPMQLAIKKLIRGMACHGRQDRLTMTETVQRLEAIQSQLPRQAPIAAPRRTLSTKSLTAADLQDSPIKPRQDPSPVEVTPNPRPMPNLSLLRSMKKFSRGDVVDVNRTGRKVKYLEQRGMVTRLEEETGCVFVDFATGTSERMQIDLVQPVDMSGQVIDEGDMVMISSDRRQLQKLHRNSFCADMEKLPGKSAFVEELREDSTARVKFRHNKKLWTIHIQSLKLLFKKEELQKHGVKS